METIFMTIQFFYIFTIVLLENLVACTAKQRQYMRKSLYYPYRSTHKSIYLNYRRQYDDYNANQEPTNSIYLPNFDKNVTKEESQTESGTASSPSFSPTYSSSGLNATDINVSEPFNTIVVNNITSSDIKEIITPAILTSINTTTVVTTDTLLDDTSTSSSVTSTLLSPPTFELFSPGTQDQNFSYFIPTTTENPIVKQIKELSHKDGYFTASAIVLLETLASMNGTIVKCLLTSLYFEVERLESENQFSIFGGKPAEIFMVTVQMLTVEPEDVMKNQLKYAIYGIENRNAFLKDDANTLLDIVDTVYLERDGEDIAEVLEEIKSSNCSSSKVLVGDLLKVFLFTPFQRVEGTARENVISAGIKHIIDYRFKDMDVF